LANTSLNASKFWFVDFLLCIDCVFTTGLDVVKASLQTSTFLFDLFCYFGKDGDFCICLDELEAEVDVGF
jgi:hypothetical protein